MSEDGTRRWRGAGARWQTTAWTLLAITLICAGVACGQQEDIGDVALGPQGEMVRGTVSVAAPDHLMVKTEEGPSYRIVATTNTRIMKDRQPVKLAEVHVGDGLGAVGNIDDASKTIHAVMLFVIDAAEIRKAREGLGKTFISGRIVAIAADELQLTIKRPDNVAQKITVDEGTSFKRGTRRMGDASLGFGPAPERAPNSTGQAGHTGQAAESKPVAESITLADVHVGDRVFGTGSLKSGVFVPTELYVFDAGALRHQHAAANATEPH